MNNPENLIDMLKKLRRSFAEAQHFIAMNGTKLSKEEAGESLKQLAMLTHQLEDMIIYLKIKQRGL